MLSTVTFKQKAFEMLPDSRVKLKLPQTYARREIVLEYRLKQDIVLGKVQQVKLVYDPKTGDWYLHITHLVSVKYREQGNVMSLDLGIVNIAAALVSDGFSFTVPGGELLALDRYFQKEKAKCTNSRSRKCRELNRKWGRQRKHYLHVLTRWLINQAVAHNVSTIVVGELKGIRVNKDWGDEGNQRLHAWPFSKIVQLLSYKARPAVNLFVWRKTTPLGREQGTFKQAS